MDDTSAPGDTSVSRRAFLKAALVGAGVLTIPGVIVITRDGGDGVSSFDIRYDESVQVVFAFGTRAGTYDISVRRDGNELERFASVDPLEVADLESEYFRVTPSAAPVAA